MDARFRLPSVDGGEERRNKIYRTVRASDALQHALPYWHRYFGSISAELESILEGTFTVAKNGLPLQPILPNGLMPAAWNTLSDSIVFPIAF
jgi:hypothetical protein